LALDSENAGGCECGRSDLIEKAMAIHGFSPFASDELLL
jgi:hypothetical protein